MNKFQQNLKDALKKSGGQFMTVTFEKKDGTLRTINCKYGQVPGHNGDNPVSHIEKYLTVSLAQKDENGNTQFRNIDVTKIKTIRIGKLDIKINE